MTFKIGAHVSKAGGFPKALERERAVGGNCGQIFVKSPRTWRFADLSESESQDFRQEYEESSLKPFMVHGTYLINLATPKDDLFEKSIRCLRDEIKRTERLNIPYITFHPGAHTGSGEERGMKRIIRALDQLKNILEDSETQLLLENTAGKGTTLGYSMKQLQRMKNQTKSPDIGVCFDTAHAYAAGYEISTDEGIQETIKEIEDTISLESIKMIHLNDSKAPLGSKKDQHAHLTEGKFGEEGIKTFINHKAFRNTPMIRESPFKKKDIQTAKRLRVEE